MATYPLSILSPRGKAFEGPAESVSAPGAAGGFGILANHAPMIAAVEPGLTTVVSGGQTAYFFTGEGVVEVNRDEVVVLVDEADPVATPAEAHAKVMERKHRVDARRSAGKAWSTPT